MHLSRWGEVFMLQDQMVSPLSVLIVIENQKS
jgi:hypothetical protein